MINKLRFAEISYEATTEEEWQRRHKLEHKLDQSGFGGDDEVVALGLEEMEDELTPEQVLLERMTKVGRRTAMPVGEATADERRNARIGEHPGDLGLDEDEVW